MTVHSFQAIRNGQVQKHFLGTKIPQPGALRFKLGDYLDLDPITVPHVFGFISNTIEWGMLGNDQAGCCVVSGAAHEHMCWTRATAKKVAPFEDMDVLNTYTSVTGWDGEGGDESDTGLDPVSFAEYRRTTGIRDSHGGIHRVRAYAEIAGPNIDNVIKAAYVFGAVGLGVKLPQSAEMQFDSAVPWTPVQHSGIMGGHYVPLLGRNSHGNLVIVTWGRLQAITPEWFERYCDIAVAYITDDFIAGGHSPRGFDEARLERDLKQLRG
jgi:hypothetical protein